MPKTRSGPIRVLIVEDSPTARQLLVGIFANEKDFKVVGVAGNGRQGVELARSLQPDVITMDIQMPEMDGLEATRRIMREAPAPIVIVTSSFHRSESDLTFEALKAGALMVVRKPGLADPETCTSLVRSVRLMAGVPVVHHWGRGQAPVPSSSPSDAVVKAPPASDSLRHIQVVGMAASTGGPSVLASILGQLPSEFPLPVLVVQHITIGFGNGLAEWLDSQVRLTVRLAAHGHTPQPGEVLLAPDDYHMKVNRTGVVELYKEPRYKGLRPSANELFRTMAEAYGPRALGIILTGMGDDGASGLEALHTAGGKTIAQDEASCVVFGMPREAIALHAVDFVYNPDQIVQALLKICQPQQKHRRG